MQKIFHLSTCSTCQAILKQLQIPSSVELIDIKNRLIDAQTLDWLKSKIGSYEALFSKRAIKYKAMGLAEKQLTESDYRKLLLEEYTFLKRPVIIFNEECWVGNSKKEVESAVKYFSQIN